MIGPVLEFPFSCKQNFEKTKENLFHSMFSLQSNDGHGVAGKCFRYVYYLSILLKS